jgi:hypothetical protein
VRCEWKLVFYPASLGSRAMRPRDSVSRIPTIVLGIIGYNKYSITSIVEGDEDYLLTLLYKRLAQAYLTNLVS